MKRKLFNRTLAVLLSLMLLAALMPVSYTHLYLHHLPQVFM